MWSHPIKFDVFWSEMKDILRWVDSSCGRKMTIYIVSSHFNPWALHDTITHVTISSWQLNFLADEEKDVPSLEWICYKFWPKNPYSTCAFHHTGRFSIKFGVLSRQMRKDYMLTPTMWTPCLILCTCMQLRDHVMYISADDKAIIPVGEPGLPVATGVRARSQSLVGT